jgi:hypothetical protein
MTTPPLTLEVGKVYVTRDGVRDRIVSCDRINPADGKEIYFGESGFAYSHNGKCPGVPSCHLIAIATEQAEPTVTWRDCQQRLDAMVEEYEWRGDNGDYTPNERERGLLTDFAAGVFSDDELLALLRRAFRPSPPTDSARVEAYTEADAAALVEFARGFRFTVVEASFYKDAYLHVDRPDCSCTIRLQNDSTGSAYIAEIERRRRAALAAFPGGAG